MTFFASASIISKFEQYFLPFAMPSGYVAIGCLCRQNPGCRPVLELPSALHAFESSQSSEGRTVLPSHIDSRVPTVLPGNLLQPGECLSIRSDHRNEEHREQSFRLPAESMEARRGDQE